MMRRLGTALLILLLAAAGVIVFLSRHSFVREKRDIPIPLPSATRADYSLLLQKWLKGQGYSTTRKGGPILKSELPPQGTLFLQQLAHPLSETEAALLLDWVESGGVLVADATLGPFNDERGIQTLLNRLDLSVCKEDSEGQDGDEGGEEDWEIQEDIFNEGEVPYRIRRSNRWRMSYEEGAWEQVLAGDDGAVLVQRRQGKGSLTILSDASFLCNDQLGELDHAAWLARVLTLGGSHPAVPSKSAVLAKPTEAVVWSKPVELALFPWLWAKAWPFLTAVTVLVLAWLWSGLFRFGSVLLPEARPRRSLLEHLQASGRFLWREGGREALLAVSREAILRRVQRVYPAFLNLSELEQRAYLSQSSGLPEEDVADALDLHPGISTEEQARRLQILQTLRQRLLR